MCSVCLSVAAGIIVKTVTPLRYTAYWRGSQERNNVCLFAGCLTSQQQASVSQGRICSDNFTCCHTETEVADQTFYLTQSQYTDTGPTSPNADPITPGAWQGSHWRRNNEQTQNKTTAEHKTRFVCVADAVGVQRERARQDHHPGPADRGAEGRRGQRASRGRGAPQAGRPPLPRLLRLPHVRAPLHHDPRDGGHRPPHRQQARLTSSAICCRGLLLPLRDTSWHHSGYVIPCCRYWHNFVFRLDDSGQLIFLDDVVVCTSRLALTLVDVTLTSRCCHHCAPGEASFVLLTSITICWWPPDERHRYPYCQCSLTYAWRSKHSLEPRREQRWCVDWTDVHCKCERAKWVQVKMFCEVKVSERREILPSKPFEFISYPPLHCLCGVQTLPWISFALQTKRESLEPEASCVTNPLVVSSLSRNRREAMGDNVSVKLW